MDSPTYSGLKTSLFPYSFMTVLIAMLVFAITITTSMQQVGAFQLVAGPVIVNVNPGETKSFSWGLLAGNNETSTLKVYADGNGSEFLSVPETFKLAPGKINYVVGNVTIPPNHFTIATLNPIVHSTLSENDTANTGGNAVNVELSKMLTITIGANNTQPIITNNLTSNPSAQQPALIGLGLLTKGTINSIITTPETQWIASGNWSLNVNDGNTTLFETKMTWNNINGTNAHSHEFQNLRVSKPISLNQSEKNISIKGLLDVGTNQRVIWKDVPSTININGKKTISISVDDNMTNHHFASQPILGVVSSFLICSDIPGPNMEVLPSCSESTVGEESFGLTNDSSAFAPSEESSTYQGASPEGIPPGGISPGNEQTGGGVILPGDEQTGGGVIPPTDEQTGGGVILPGDEQTGGQVILPADEQTGGQVILPADEQTGGGEINQECTDLNIANITANGFESDPADFHPPSDAIDGASSTWWSFNGKDPWVEIDLSEPQSICGLSVEWNKGDERKYSFEIEVSEDGNNYQKVFEGNNKKGSLGQEKYTFEEPINGQYVKLTITSTSSKDGWVSMKEINALGFPSRYDQTAGRGIPPGDNQTG